MREILVFVIAAATFLLVTLSLWRKRTKNTSQIAANLESYWDGKTEKRRAIRFKKKLNVTCNVPENKGSTYHIFSKDISGEGICLQVPEILPEGSILDLKVDIPNNRPIAVTGVVAWVNEFPREAKESERLFDTGIKFIKVDPKDKQRLSNFLDLDKCKKA